MSGYQLLYLSRADVEATGVSMAEIIEAVQAGFREKGLGRVEAPPKLAIHPGGGDNFCHAMPAYIPAERSAGVKWVSGFPGNSALGLPYISGLLILNDPDTGLPISVMDCTWITAMRTGAATAVAAKYLARPNAAVVGVLGCGVQGRTNVEALGVLFPLKRVMAYDANTGSASRYAEEISERLGLDARAVDTPRQAVTGCDIVVTAGPILKKPHRTIQADWLDEGAFASLVDYDSYWHPDAMRQAKFCTDDVAQLRYHQTTGYFQEIPPIYADLGELVTGQKPGRLTAAERTMTANLGLAMDDMAVAPLVYQRAVGQGLGTWLPL
jgi:ornithine cyclodeaminase/alanine dehydrogenase-like protein (mu-crystallin family)